MTHVLAMSALELRHPVIFRVRVKAGDFLVHREDHRTGVERSSQRASGMRIG